jgi:hypothetical protein
MKVKVPDYTASDRQTVFHQTVADEKLYGGAAGGGKTAAIVAEGGTVALEHPGIPINFFRRTIPELKSTILPEIYKQFGQYIKAGHMTWHGQDRQFRLANGSTLNLNYCDTDADVYRYQGTEMPWIGVDELTQFPQAWIEYLKTRNRTSNPDWPVRFVAGTNPGGIGHGWVKNRYIDIGPPETIYTDLESKETRVFIPAKVDDHPLQKFKEDYSKKLNAISDIELRKALRDGDWDVFAGQVFTEWSRNKHVVEPFPIPNHWIKWFSYDHGYNTFAAGLWYAQDPITERKYVYREMYETQRGVSELASLKKRLEGQEKPVPNLADPAIWKGAGDQNTGKSVAEMFQAEGVSFTPANNDRLAGKAAVHEALAIAPDGLPKLQVFANCVNLIRTLPSLPYDQHRVEDVDTKAEDHLYDSLRYGLMSQRSTNTTKPYKPRAMLERKYGK